ncbi:MAG: hypothetical protein LBL60_02820 [Mycoplasmataceae bacterium]|jgi:capsular polysaccharide biosynthesis protein|nr:hypothetical protein [Mycoplasmataceae bacterium]
MSNNHQEKIKKEITSRIENVDFSKLPTSDEFQKIKVKPKNRLFNSLITLIMTTTGICLGVIIGMIIYHFV